MRASAASLILGFTVTTESFTPSQQDLHVFGGGWVQDRPVRAIATGDDHTLVLLEDSTVFAWGANDSGQTEVPGGLTEVVAIKAGGSSSAARTKDGRIIIWGSNSIRLGAPATLRDAKDFVLADGFGAALMPDSTLMWWGRHTPISKNLTKTKATKIKTDGNTIAVLWADGHVQAKDTYALAQGNGSIWPTPSNPIVDMAVGASHVVALHRDSTISCSNTSGETSLNTCPKLTSVVSIAAAYFKSGALTSDGTIKTWGEDIDTGVKRFPGERIDQLQLAKNSNFVVTGSGSLLGWNSISNGIVIDPTHASNAVAIGLGRLHSLVLHRDGSVTAQGNYNISRNVYVPPGLANVKKLVGGMDYSAALLGDGSIVVWGDSVTKALLAVPEGLSDVVDIAGGYASILALKRDGTVSYWEDPRVLQEDPPRTLSGVKAISPSMALMNDGTIQAWGWFRSPSVNDYTAIANSGELAMALRRNGTVLTWGSGDSKHDTPADLTDVVSISAGNDHALALKSDGSVVAWGSNSFGQTNIPKGFKARAIAAGYNGSWLLRDTTSMTVSLSPRIQHHPKGFEPGKYFVHGVDGTMLGEAELGNPEDLRQFQMQGRILFLRRIPSGKVVKYVTIGRN